MGVFDQLKSEAQSAGAGLAAKQEAVDQIKRPLVSAPVQVPTSPVDLLHPHALYGDRAGEQRINTADMTRRLGFSGVKRTK